MNIKEKIIKKLLDVGKKHRILVYPTLALVAVVSAISNAVYWGRGNGKRFVASVMVMALLITQSLFLTSSANNGESLPQGANTASETDAQYYTDNSVDAQTIDGSQVVGNSQTIDGSQVVDNSQTADGSQTTDGSQNTGNIQNQEALLITGEEELVPQSEAAAPAYSSIKVIVSIPGSDNKSVSYIQPLTDNGNGTYSIPADFALKSSMVHQALFGDVSTDYIEYSGMYKDSGYSVVLPADLNDFEKDDTEQVYLAYAYAKVKKVNVVYEAEEGLGITNTIYGVDASGSGTGESYNPDTRELTLTLGNAAHYDSISDIKQSPRRGYIFTGLKYGGSAYTEGTPITLEPGQITVNVATGWAPKDVIITYDPIADSDPLYPDSVGENETAPTETYKFNATLSLANPVNSEWAEPNEGYVFDYWSLNGNSTKDCQSIEALLALDPDNINYEGDTINVGLLVGNWKYKDYVLTGLDADNTVNGVYGDPVDCTIGVKYASGEAAGSRFGMLIDEANIYSIFADFGVNIEGGAPLEGTSYYTTYNVSGDVKAITTGEVTIPVKVYDMNKPAAEQEMTGAVIKFVFNPRTVTINPQSVKDSNDTGKAPHKTYDGNTKITVVTEAALDNLVFDDSVKATFASDATFDTADAGINNKDVTLKNVTLAGEKAHNYVIETGEGGTVTIPDVGSIEQKPITIYMKLKDSDPAVKDTSVKYGEENPEYELYLDDASVLSLSENDKSAYENDKTTFLANILGHTGWDYARSSFSPSGKSYKVQPVFSGDKNYLVNTVGLEGSITVERDVAELGVNYTLSEKQSEEFYRDIKISPTGGYNQIRLCSSESDDITSDSELSAAKFKAELTNADLEDMTDATVYVQMRDSSSGAITTVGSIKSLNIDTSGPKLNGFDVNPNGDKLNIFNFGAYYHPQDDVNVLTFTFYYESDDSDCDMLHYYLEDKDGNKTDVNTANQKLVDTGETTEAGAKLYKASITLNVDNYGQLIVYATDKAGNQSAFSRVKVDTFNDFTESKPSDYYEWMVENTMTDAELSVLCNKEVASTQGVIYNHLDLVIDANDVVNNNPTSGVNMVEWKITDTEDNVVYSNSAVVPDDKKYEAYTFTDSFPAMGTELLGTYYVSATVYDNAGNAVDIGPKGPYAVDSIRPVISDKTEAMTPDSFLSGAQFEFQVDEGEGESGIDKITLYQKTGAAEKDWTVLEEWSNLSGDSLYSMLCSRNITENGTYVVVAYDKAGNKSESFEKQFKGISDVVPDAPTISVAVGNKNEESGWYIETKPNVKITTNNKMMNGVPVTNDNVPLHTDYKITVAGTQTDVQRTYTASEYPFYLEYDGEVTITAVNVSASNKKSTEATAVIKVDTEKPVIEITGSTIDTSGNLVVNYEIRDKVSGVNRSKVTVNDEAILVDEPDSDGTIKASFVAEPGITYSIAAEDIAGNKADLVEFKPLALNVSPVTDITTSSALLYADIEVGTYPLNNYYIAYKKHDAAKYSKYSLVSTETTEDGIKITCPFKNLESDTVYDYMIYAVTETSKEVKEYTGSFKTGATNAAATVYGSVKYDDNLIDSLKTYPIYVTLYKGDVAVGGIEISSDVNKEYYFKNVPDGSYQITATNGKLSKTASVTVAKGGVTYPEDYLSMNGINMVLNGLSTSVAIEDDEIELTADDLDVIYDDDFNINISDDEYDIVNEGGNILVTLHANYLNVATDVDTNTEGIIKDKLGNNAEIVRYIELYVTKTVTDKDGAQTTSYITELADPITVSFPLGDLAGQRIYVASLHAGLLNNSDYDFYNWGTASSAVLSHDYVTITTSRFSVYALYRMKVTDRYFTVKWIDGDGNVMKTETVKEGEAATPPTATPTKTPTDKYTYTFEAWDVDYSTINKDTIVSAWFTANKVVPPDEPKPEDPTTEQPKPEDPTTEQPKPDKPSTEQPAPNKVPSTNVTTPTNNSAPDISTSTGNKYTYLGSASSPKTGDAAPIVIIGVLMVISALGLVVISKKRKDD